MDLQTALVEHLAWWGLRSFDSDAAYFQWQRDTLGKEILADLHRLVAAKQAPDAPPAAETAFYDRTADPRVMPVLYSQRYHYYLSLGPLIARLIRAGPAGPRTILDCGCGIGVLTAYYAMIFPAHRFVGVDRSAASLAVAREKARALQLTNLDFEELDLDRTPPHGPYDLIIATQTLLQSERDAGLPSRSWDTFERERTEQAQAAFEARTSLGSKLDHLRQAMAPQGRLVLFEKARQLARRVPLQRALAGRGWHLLEDPVPVRYPVVEDVSDDGPLYSLALAPADPAVRWDEAPEQGDESAIFRCCGPAAESIHERLPGRVAGTDRRWDDRHLGEVRIERGTAAGCLAYLYLTAGHEFRGILVGPEGSGSELDRRLNRLLAGADPAGGDGAPTAQVIGETWPASSASDDRENTPLYENHRASAQDVWVGLASKTLLKQQTWDEAQTGRMHVEVGQGGPLAYLYQSNAYDQRQVVMVERARAALLESYYQELTAAAPPPR